jgi:hypothetical protein
MSRYNYNCTNIPEPSLEEPSSYGDNQATREILGYCRDCGEPIYDGDPHYKLDDFEDNIFDLMFCNSCVNNSRRY